GVEDGPREPAADPAVRLRRADAQHAVAVPGRVGADPGDALHPRQPRDLSARRAAARAAAGDPDHRRDGSGPRDGRAARDWEASMTRKQQPSRARRFVSNVLAIAYKEASLLRHDRTVVQNVLMQPIMLLIVMGFGLRFTPRDVPWVALDRSNT